MIPRKSNQCDTKIVSKQPLIGFLQYDYSEKTEKLPGKHLCLIIFWIRLDNFEMEIFQIHENLVKKKLRHGCFIHFIQLRL